jgi:hypothetical protein
LPFAKAREAGFTGILNYQGDCGSEGPQPVAMFVSASFYGVKAKISRKRFNIKWL